MLRLNVQVLDEFPELCEVVLADGTGHEPRARVVTGPATDILAVRVEPIADEHDDRLASPTIHHPRETLEGEFESTSKCSVCSHLFLASYSGKWCKNLVIRGNHLKMVGKSSKICKLLFIIKSHAL